MRSAALLLSLAGCFPAHDYAGLACDATHACPDGLACTAGVCGGTGGAGGGTGGGSANGGGRGGGTGGAGGSGNLLASGDFESGVGDWYATSTDTDFESQTTRVRSGAHAMRVFAKSVGSTLSVGLQREVITGVSDGVTFCIEAWVDRGNQVQPIKLITRRYAASASDWEDTGTVTTDAGVSGWQRVVAAVTAAAPKDLYVNLRFSGQAVSGGEFFVDDVRVTRVAAPAACQ
ncbi:MAG: hypothetical protein IPJ65_28855 [Archangiaceae bacterium]|nr:hypothetical protein [Archangiaceae bacterium]